MADTFWQPNPLQVPPEEPPTTILWTSILPKHRAGARCSASRAVSHRPVLGHGDPRFLMHIVDRSHLGTGTRARRARRCQVPGHCRCQVPVGGDSRQQIRNRTCRARRSCPARRHRNRGQSGDRRSTARVIGNLARPWPNPPSRPLPPPVPHCRSRIRNIARVYPSAGSCARSPPPAPGT